MIIFYDQNQQDKRNQKIKQTTSKTPIRFVRI
jgi:hypothetical protein